MTTQLQKQYQLAQHLMGNRRRLRWLYPDYKRGIAECMALALEARLFQWMILKPSRRPLATIKEDIKKTDNCLKPSLIIH